MKRNDICLLVTGGAGFIGSALVREIIRTTDWRIVNVDKLTYAGNLDSLEEAYDHPRHSFEKVDICDSKALDRVFREYRPDMVMHLAAESHVDRSIEGPAEFVQTNIVGTSRLLDVARAYWNELKGESKEIFRFHHISTDEVYGDLSIGDPAFTEKTPYAPNSPYSASKASSDHLVRAWHRTYGFPVILTNCSNNYGPYQFPEKLIPLMILNALEGKALPIYGKGDNIRDWLYVEDHVRALICVLLEGQIGRTYNVGGRNEKTNLEVVQSLCGHLDDLIPSSEGSYDRLIKFVVDRPGHDQRYAVNDERIEQELGWKPIESFDTGLEKTIRWYLESSKWVARVRNGEYREWLHVNYANRKAGQ